MAIRGETHDGHRFIPQAIEKGATGIISEEHVDVSENVTVIQVENSVTYLIDEARKKLRHHNPDVVAITGSVGKTSTRSAIQAVLSQEFDVVASEGNRNTPLGISLTLLNAAFDRSTKLVLEMGARLKGDIKELCSYFPPTVAVVTNVKSVHVETFGSIEGVQHEKSELVKALGSDGTACLNGDDPQTRAMADLHNGKTLLFGTTEDCHIRPEYITAKLPILGDHAIYTALAACSAGRALGMSFESINHGLEHIKPEKGRLAKLRGRSESVLIDDTYNASPEATRSAIRVAATYPGTRRVAFLGDMLELGENEIDEHVDVLAFALNTLDAVYAVGPIMAAASERLSAVQKENLYLFPTSAELAEAIRNGTEFTPDSGDVILVKGSQGRRMERVSEVLLHPALNPADVLPRQSESWKQIA